MNPPPFPEITPEQLHAIAQQHNLGVETFKLLPQIGLFNQIYQAGEEYILRIARIHPRSFAVARREAIVVPLARMVGVRTPELLVMDDSCAILPAPYTVYARIQGATLGLLDLEPHDTPAVWRAVGRDLALLHHGIPQTEATAELEAVMVGEPYLWIDELTEAGHFTPMEARWFTQWLERLESASPTSIPDHCLHGDNQTTNIMVGTDALEYRAIIDWGNTGWGDPAFDFAGIPLRAVPYLLEGYRGIAPMADDETAEARILRRHLTLALYNLRGAPAPTLSWAERPLTFITEIMRFLLETKDPRWHSLL